MNRNFYINPEITSLKKKWWHKLVFWKRYTYPTYTAKMVVTNLKDIEVNND